MPAAEWWRGDRESRYDYLYSAPEQAQLTAEVRLVAERSQDTYAFYNNHYGAKAVANATQLQAALGQPVTGSFLPEMLARYPDLGTLAPQQATPVDA